LKKEFNIQDNKGIAVAVNMTVVPYSKWGEVTINNNDEIEIVHAVQGG
jgi:sulfur carrier protein